MEELLRKRVENFKKLLSLEKKIDLTAKLVTSAFKSGNKVLLCGNGGSASDANHIAAEFISKFKKIRKSLPAISLCANNSILTAIGNDFSFNDVFKRQIEGLGVKNDILFAISTSGKSKNIIQAIQKAHDSGLKTVLLTGENKSNLNCDIELNMPSCITAEIQEMHIAVSHIICEMVEKEF